MGGPRDVTFSLHEIVKMPQELCKKIKIMKNDTSPALLLHVSAMYPNVQLQYFKYIICVVPEIVRSRKSTVAFTGYCHSERPVPRPSKHTNPNDTIEMEFLDEASAQAIVAEAKKMLQLDLTNKKHRRLTNVA